MPSQPSLAIYLTAHFLGLLRWKKNISISFSEEVVCCVCLQMHIWNITASSCRVKYAILRYGSPLRNQAVRLQNTIWLSCMRRCRTKVPTALGKKEHSGEGNQALHSSCLVVYTARDSAPKISQFLEPLKGSSGRVRQSPALSWGLSTTSTWSYFSGLIALCRSVARIMLHLASQSSWNQITHWPNRIAAESSSWTASSPLPSSLQFEGFWLCLK